MTEKDSRAEVMPHKRDEIKKIYSHNNDCSNYYFLNLIGGLIEN